MLWAIVFFLLFGIPLESHPVQKQQTKKAVTREQPKVGGTLVVGLAKLPGNPNPFIQTSSTTQFVREASYESLLTLDEDDRIVPNLASSYEVSAGGRQFTLRLRKE